MNRILLDEVSNFVLQSLYESFRNAAAVAVVAFGSDQVSLFTIDWHTVLGLAGGAFIVTLLTCLAAQPFGDKTSPSPIPGVLHTYYTQPAAITVTPATVEASPTSIPTVEPIAPITVTGGAHAAVPTMGAETAQQGQ